MLPVFLLATVTWVKHKHVCQSHCSVSASIDECCSEKVEVKKHSCCEETPSENEAHCSKEDNCCFDETLVLDANMGDFEKHERAKTFQFIPDFLLLKISTKGATIFESQPKSAEKRHPKTKPGPKKNLLFCCFRC